MRTPAALGRHCKGYDNRVFFDQEMRRPAQEQDSVNGEATVNLNREIPSLESPHRSLRWSIQKLDHLAGG